MELLDKEPIRARIYEYYREIGLPLDKIQEFYCNTRWLIALLHKLTNVTIQNPQTWFDLCLLNPDFRRAIVLNRYEEIDWFNKEAFEAMLWHMELILSNEIQAEDDSETTNKEQRMQLLNELLATLRKAEDASAYQIERLREALID